jgi:hypothetical protein
MAKIGLSRESKKYLDVVLYPKDIGMAAMLYVQGKEFYRAFKILFGNGYYEVLDGIKIPNTNSTFLVNYHLSIECLLKSIICLKTKVIDKKHENHDLNFLLKEACLLFPDLHKTMKCEYILLLETLGNNFSIIRYQQGMICWSGNKRKGWQTKDPQEEISKIFDDIFNILENFFRENR